MMRRGLLVSALMLALTGCATQVEKAPSSLPIPAAWRNSVGPAAAPEAEWWRAFHDAYLNRLVTQALRNNPDILTAHSRVDQYRAQLRATQGDEFPTLSAGVAATRERTLSSVTGQPYETDVFQGLLQANYEVDLWGARSNSVSASQASLALQQAAASAAELTIASSVASGYLNLCALDEQLRVTEATLATRNNSLKLAQRQFESGYTSRLEWMQAASEYQSAKAQIPQLQHQIAQQENALSILVGMNPRSIARRQQFDQILPQQMPSLLPSELLNREALTAQVDVSMATRNQALYGYEKVVRNAFSEVNDALDAIRQREAQLQELQKQETYVTEALRIARNRYQNGYASYLDELDAQRTLFSTQLNRVAVKNNLLLAQIDLYRALGGGWAPASTQ